MDLAAIAAEIRAAQDEARQIEPLARRHPSFDEPAAYQVAARVHQHRLAEGAVPRGRKIGFTNSNIWPQYNVHQPIWGWMYEHTLLRALPGTEAAVSLAGLAEPKIEPEIAFGLRTSPPVDADLNALLACIEWVAPAFEIVQSHCPGWKFAAADTIADGGLHGRLVLGVPVPLESLGPDPADRLARLAMVLRCDGEEVETGSGSNVLGSPLAALAHLAALVPGELRTGEIVTTGTLTAAYPIRPGQRWTADPRGIDLQALLVAFEA